MTNAAIRVAPYSRGPDAVAVVNAVNGLRTMLPTAEPLSVGEPPIEPSRVQRAAPVWPVRRLRLACGLLKTSSMDADPRTTFDAEWTGLDAGQRGLLEAFFEDTCGSGVNAMTLYPDGRGGDPVAVRALTASEFVLVDGRSGTQSPAAVGTYECRLTLEEVIA
ncbi:MAG: hypothetical protein AAGI53_01715 [Planctomycetota bacterium]